MQRFANNVFAQLTGELGAGGTVLPMPAEVMARLPMDVGDYYLLTLVSTLDITQQTKVEVVKASLGADGAIAIEREMEGTSASVWPAGTWVFCSITAGTLAGMAGAVAAQANTIQQQADQLIQQQQAIQALLARVTALEGGTAPDGVLLDAAGNYLVDGQGNNLKGV